MLKSLQRLTWILIHLLGILFGTALGITSCSTTGGKHNSSLLSYEPILDQRQINALKKYGLAYVIHRDLNELGYYFFDPSGKTLRFGGSVRTGLEPSSLVADSVGKYIYVANQGSNTISTFLFDRHTYRLREIDHSTRTKEQPIALILSPDEKFLYVLNSGAKSISAYRRNTIAGDLTLLHTVQSQDHIPITIAIDPNGKYLYVAGFASKTLTALQIQPGTGKLKSKPISTELPSPPSSIVPSGGGGFLYIVSFTDNQIFTYQWNREETLLRPVNTSAPTGSMPNVLAIDESRKFAYTLNLESKDISFFRIQNGKLISLKSEPIPQGEKAMTLGMGPKDRFAYISYLFSKEILICDPDQRHGILLDQCQSSSTRGMPHAIQFAPLP